jgi:4-hydroxy-3-methylbut-2-en-1-yl diphosphate reductase
MKQFNVPGKYRSPLIAAVKDKRKQQDKLKKNLSPTFLDFGPIQFYLARHFGFCYGVENAIEKAFTTIDENPGRRIFLLSEMIHNPQVNRDLQQRGVRFLQDTSGRQLVPFDELTSEDIAIIPAFGTTLEIESQLTSRGIPIEQYNTTCPFVEKVWNRSEQIAKSDYTIVIHGKPRHEETRATFSHASSHAASVIVNDMDEAVKLSRYITGEASTDNFFEEFAGRYSPGFNPIIHLQRIGVVNQTTQLASETQAIADFLKQVMMKHYDLNESNIEERFADTRDTLCYATNDNQSAVINLLNTPADISVVVGGYNSSNTTHLVELCEEKLPCFFINSEEKILSFTEILHYNWHTKQEETTHYYLPAKQPVKILLTSGASCPDAVVEAVIRKLVSYYPDAKSIEEVAESFS